MHYPYQLVLRFLASSPLESAYIEEDIAEALGNPFDSPKADHLVEGNEIGDGIDIFIRTQDPVTAFEKCKPLLIELDLLSTMTAEWRELNCSQFHSIHP